MHVLYLLSGHLSNTEVRQPLGCGQVSSGHINEEEEEEEEEEEKELEKEKEWRETINYYKGEWNAICNHSNRG